MKAAVCERYGPPEVVQIRDVPKPVPADGDVLVKAFATTVNSGDARVRGLRVPRGMRLPMRLKLGFTKPKQPILGLDTAGQVEAVGRAVSRFRPGDRVVASRGFDFGCHAEYVSVAERGAIARIPENLDYQGAVALCFGGAAALNFFRLGKLAPGETVLINGASGAVGTMALQLAKHLGAEVTAVCSGANAALARDLGADHIVDYTTEDFTGNGQRYDVIMDNHGNAPYGADQGLAQAGRPLPDGCRRPLADARRVAAEGHDQRARERFLNHRRQLSNPHVAGRAGSGQAGDRLRPALRADHRSASPGRRRTQGRERCAHVWGAPLNASDPSFSREATHAERSALASARQRSALIAPNH